MTFVLHKITAGNPHLGAGLTPWLPDPQNLLGTPGGLADLQALVTYIFLVGETGEDDLDPPDPAQLLTWSQRLFTATSLDEVFTAS
ncbi:hypothetical protein [Nocardia higoensis]|uniref:hypothetical protein n=1 Tax=Nocardia higoensis TaxID=228599 RepID=UPI0003003951|nr:hypothetical protein [Nocardia higoensis]